MPDTVETALGIAIDQVTGDNEDTWGDVLDANWAAVVQAICNSTSKTVTGAGDVTLTQAERRKPVLLLSGTLTANQNIIVEAIEKLYLVKNDTAGSFTVTVKTAAGTGIVVPQGQVRLLRCDGTNVVELKIFDRNQLFTGLYGGALGGTATAATLTVANFTSAGYADGQIFFARVTATNTGAFTLDVNSIGAAAVVTHDNSPLREGVLKLGGIYGFAYSSALSKFVLLGVHGPALKDAKDSVRAATTANITLSGTQTVDGVSLQAGDRCLVKDQSTGAQNGIYVVSASSWTRADDFDENAEVTSGAYAYISEGTVNGGRIYVLSTADAITLGSTSLTFTFYDPAIVLSGLATETTFALDDLLAFVDTSASSASRKGTITNFLKVISLLPAVEPARATDTIVLYDSSGAVVAKATINDANNVVPTAKISVTAAASITIAIDNDTYDSFEIELRDVRPVTDNVSLRLRTRQDGGSSFDSGASDYRWAYEGTGTGGGFASASGGDTLIQLTPNIDIDGTFGVSGIIRVNSANLGTPTRVLTQFNFEPQSGTFGGVNGGGVRAHNSKTDGVQIFFATGNIAAGGEIVVRGFRDPS